MKEIPERVVKRAGFRRENEAGTWEYFVLPEAWRREVCKGFDHVALARAMVAKGWMTPGEAGNLAAKRRIPKHGPIRGLSRRFGIPGGKLGLRLEPVKAIGRPSRGKGV